MSQFRYLPLTLRAINNLVNGEQFKKCVVTITQSRNIQKRLCSSEAISRSEALKRSDAVLGPAEKVDLSDYGSVLLPTYNFAAYADKSPLLQEFIKLGVELYKLEKNPEVGEFLLSLNFEKNVKPYLEFLHHNGVSADEFGQIITKHPFLLKEDLDDLEVRINYLESKKFDRNMISRIITKNPKWLSAPVVTIDARLGFLQQTFHLKGDQVRKIVSGIPILGTLRKEKLMTNIFILKEEMDLNPHELKKLVVEWPYLLKMNSNQLISTFDYLQREMQIPQCFILKQPKVLKCRKHILKERHRFLQSLGRAQYNPLLPGYISLEDLVQTTDEEFCCRLAKTSVYSYTEFLKTL